MRFSKFAAIAGLSVVFSPMSHAAVDINSFLTLGITSISEEGSYLDKATEHYSYENDSHYGINLRAQITEKVSTGAQLLATSTNNTNFNVDAEWAYMSYQFSKDSSLRAGKLNLTTFLLSDYANVGYLHPWVRPPVEVYRNNPMKSYLGLEWLYITHFGSSAKLTSQFFTGSADVQNGAFEMRATDGYGVNFQLDMPGFTFRVGAITPTVQVLGFSQMDNSNVELLDEGDRAVMSTVGMTLELGDFILYSEGLSTNVEGQTRAVFPNQRGAYVTLGYNIGKWLPHVTYGVSEGDAYTGSMDHLCGVYGQPSGCTLTPDMATLPATQNSITVGLKYTVDDSIAIKFEVQNVMLEEVDEGLGDGFGSIDARQQDPTSDVNSFTVFGIAMDAIF